jgi:hypothetical protein
MIVNDGVQVNRAVTTFHTIVEGTPYWFVAARAIDFLLTIFFQLFSVNQVVHPPVFIMKTVLHLSQESRSISHTLSIYLKAHNREGEVVRIEKCEEAQI